MPPRHFIRPQEYNPTLGRQSLQASLSVEDSKKKAALDLGFDPEELRDPGIGDSGDSLEDDGVSSQSPDAAHRGSARDGGQSNPQPARLPSMAHSDNEPLDLSAKKLQNQLDLLRRVNAQLTKDKEHLQKQLQQSRHHPQQPAHTVVSPKAGVDNSRVMQLLGEAEHFIAALRTSSCNYVNILKQERELYHNGAPTVVQQLQQQLHEAQRGAGDEGAAKHEKSRDAEFWKLRCQELQTKVDQQQATIRKLQDDADNAEAEAVEAENDMNRKQAAIDQLAAQLEAQQAAMENLSRRISQTDGETGLTEMGPAMSSSQAKEILSEMKKLKKSHAHLRAEAMAFCDMVAPGTWSMLVEQALQAAGSVQGRIEQLTAAKLSQDFKAQMDEMQKRLNASGIS